MIGADTPVFNAASLFPRRHPSAWLALELSLGGLVLGPPVGVPALMFARKVRRQLADNHGRFTGARIAASAEIAAWFACSLWTVAVAAMVVAAYPLAAYVVTICGLLLAALLQLRRVSRTLVALAAVAGVIASLLGVRLREFVQHERAVVQMHACDEAQKAGTAAWSSHELEPARKAYRRAEATCTGDEARLATMRLRDISDQEARARQVEDAKAQRYADLQDTQSIVHREREASRLLARFTAAEQTITPRLLEAQRHQRAKRWEKASELVQAIDAELAPFRRTELASSPRFEAMTTEAQTIAAAIEPEMTKLLARREVSRRRAEEAKTQREAAAARRRERAESWSSNRVRCCDGTLSPSCTYGGSLRGCCSWHGGVC